MSTPGKLLFLDARYIDAGRLEWHAHQGEHIGVGPGSHPPQPMHVGASSSPRGVRLQCYPADKTGALEQWQGWGRIAKMDGLFRTWRVLVDGHHLQGSASACQTPDPESVEIASLESTDGYAWSEVARCRIDVPGQTRFDGQTFFVDPIAPPQERYKLAYCARPPQKVADDLYSRYAQRQHRHQDPRIMEGVRACLYAAVSPDGLGWTAVPRPLALLHGDTDNTLDYDPDIGRYVLYTRWFRHGRRWVGRAESEDFYTWDSIQPLLWPDAAEPLDRDIYLNAYCRYPTAPGQHLMFPMFYHRSTERSDVRLSSSDDGIVWVGVPGDPVLKPGPPGAWDSEFIAGGKDLVELAPGKLAIPYIATAYPHKYPRWPEVFDAWRMGWASWPADRLASVRADEQGWFRTLPLTPHGSQLKVNCRARHAGELRIGIAGDPDRSTEKCNPIRGNIENQRVSWGEVSVLGPRARSDIVLEVRLRGAELFSISWDT